jgi:hypothetical protein
MAKRWWFKEQRELGSKSWTWRVLTVDGLIEQTSREFRDYGAAMHDAIVNGPDTDHWIIESEHHTTHFEQGKRPVNIPNAERTTPPRCVLSSRVLPARKAYPGRSAKSSSVVVVLPPPLGAGR